jgi:hypothetical protein
MGHHETVTGVMWNVLAVAMELVQTSATNAAISVMVHIV